MGEIFGYNIDRSWETLHPILKNHEKIFQARSHLIKFTFAKVSRMEEQLERGGTGQYSRQEKVRS